MTALHILPGQGVVLGGSLHSALAKASREQSVQDSACALSIQPPRPQLSLESDRLHRLATRMPP